MSSSIVCGYKMELNNLHKTACLQPVGAARWAYHCGLTCKKAFYVRQRQSISTMQLLKDLQELHKSSKLISPPKDSSFFITPQLFLSISTHALFYFVYLVYTWLATT